MWIYYIMISSQRQRQKPVPKKSSISNTPSMMKNTTKNREKKQMEKWESDLRKNRNIFTQEITSMNLVTLDKLCEYLNIHYDPKSKPASGAFNDTYFTHIIGSKSEIAIRVSQEPIARYTYYPRNRGQELMEFTGVGVNEENTKKIKKEQEGYKPPDRERVQPNKKRQWWNQTPEMPYYSLHTKEIEQGEFLIELERSKTNWLESSDKGLCPPIIYYGYIIEKKPIGGLSSGYIIKIRSCIISQKYSTDLKKFYKNLVMTGDYSPEERESINKKVLEQVQNMIRGLVDLSIICADIKPANMVVKYNTRSDGKIDVNSIKVRLIDLDGDWCIRFENGLPHTPERRSARTFELPCGSAMQRFLHVLA